jgi:hypothetical protein
VPRPSGRPSDADDAVLATGRGDVVSAVVSMSARSDDGTDGEYLRWHVLDHLPEQHRLPGLRHGQRWVSTPECRARRAAEAPPFDQVDHVVTYLFAPPVGLHLDAFFELGRALNKGGRMPRSLPRVHLAAYDLVDRRAADRILVGADVVPWRWATGVYVAVEPAASPPVPLAELVARPGVAGAWRFRGSDAHRPDRLAPSADLALTVSYLDADPVQLAGDLGELLVPDALFGAPFHVVAPPHWDRHLPG